MASLRHSDNMTLPLYLTSSFYSLISSFATLNQSTPLRMSKPRQFGMVPPTRLEPRPFPRHEHLARNDLSMLLLSLMLLLFPSLLSASLLPWELPESFQRSSEFSNCLLCVLARYHSPMCWDHPTAMSRQPGSSCLDCLPHVVMRTSPY